MANLMINDYGVEIYIITPNGSSQHPHPTLQYDTCQCPNLYFLYFISYIFVVSPYRYPNFLEKVHSIVSKKRREK